MWASCKWRACSYLLLVALVIGCLSTESSATATARRSVRSKSSYRSRSRSLSSSSAPRYSERVHEIFSRSHGLSQSDSVSSVPNLPQWATNGKSLLGTRQAQKPQKRAITSKSSTKLASRQDSPTRSYNFTIAYQDIAPDGVLRKNAILVNGAFPGPTIEANYGDWIQVEVTNNLPDDGTSFHWHGLFQKETQWMDGTPSVQQCPIAPGQTLTYRFRADQVGTSWWHSHSSAQYTSGAYGAMIIHGDETADYDEDLGPVFVSDWFHESLRDCLDITMTSANSQPPKADNLLINGKMTFNCSTTDLPCVPNAGMSKFYFSPGKKYRLRLINSGAGLNAKVSIDGHSFTVIAHDFTPVVPYSSNLVSLANGQRVDVIVEATGNLGDAYWMRYDIGDASNPAACITALGATVRTGLAMVFYKGADESIVPTTTSSIDPSLLLPCTGESIEKLVPVTVVPSEPQGNLLTIQMGINFTKESNGENRWSLNNQSYQADISRALLSRAQADTLTDADHISLYDTGESETIRVIIYDHFQFSHHPMHLHGFNFQILAEGFGQWDGAITNPSNPMRRDVHVLQKARTTAQGTIEPAYIVIQFFADNPGVWPFHCHLAWHNSAGLFSNFMVRQPEIQKLQIPNFIAQTCSSWDNTTVAATVESYDDEPI